jgi:hypothetical protein
MQRVDACIRSDWGSVGVGKREESLNFSNFFVDVGGGKSLPSHILGKLNGVPIPRAAMHRVIMVNAIARKGSAKGACGKTLLCYAVRYEPTGSGSG